jgi:hypothetical protein
VPAAIVFFLKRARAIGTQAASVSRNMDTCPGSQAKWNIAQGIETSGRKVVPRMQPIYIYIYIHTNNIDIL